jgi:hypothetical protein
MANGTIEKPQALRGVESGAIGICKIARSREISGRYQKSALRNATVFRLIFLRDEIS